MVVKQRILPIYLQKLQALNRRLPFDHPKKLEIQAEISKNQAGYNGEQSLDYHLSFISNTGHLILHNVRILGENYYFQIDTLILTPRFFLIVDAKNYSGTLHFDSTHSQLTRTLPNGKEDTFPNPIPQVERQKLQLKLWLKRNKIQSIPPIECIVAITNPYTLIKTAPNDSLTKRIVIHSIHIPSKVDHLSDKNQQVIFTNKDLRRISRLLMKQDEPYDPNILDRFGIHADSLYKGCHCPQCSALPMNRFRGKWVCMSCSFSSKDAHISALKDYALLIQPTITNQALRDFLILPSTSIASKLLTSMNLNHYGTTKGRVYQLTFDEE